MTELSSDLKKYLNDFQLICTQFNENERSNKELFSNLNHLKHRNEILTENEKKSSEQIKTVRQICNEQGKTISELYDFETKNEILNEENAALKSYVQILKGEISAIEIRKNETIQGSIIKHDIELQDMNAKFNKRERELQEKIEGLQASFYLQIYEKDKEKENIKISCDEQLKISVETEQQLKKEIFKLNNQLSSSTAVLQKKILELEQKVKNAEREKSLFNVSRGGFISANVFKNMSQTNPTQSESNSQNQIQSRTSIIRNVSQNIEINTNRKFKFRKSNRPANENVEKQLLSESFNPFEMNKQMNANDQPGQHNNNSSRQMNTTSLSNRDVTYEIIEDNSENDTGSLQGFRLKELKKSENSVISNKVNEVQILEQNKDNTKPNSPNIRKRKLFNPKNMDYLN